MFCPSGLTAYSLITPRLHITSGVKRPFSTATLGLPMTSPVDSVFLFDWQAARVNAAAATESRVFFINICFC